MADAAPEDILADHSPEVRRIANALRDLVRRVLPDVTERAYRGWHGIGFRHPEAGYLGGIFPQADHVRLLFEHGVELEDPAGLLEGDGSQARYVTVGSADLDEATLVAFLDGAVERRAH